MASAGHPLLRRLAVDLAALCSNPEDADHAFDLLNATYATEVAQAARNRLKADRTIQPLIAERYWGAWPSLSEMLAMPEGSLGHVYGTFMTAQGLSQLPAPECSASHSSDDTYLQQRIRFTHDLWHVIAGFPATLAGEAAANGLTTEQLRWPGSALLISADLIHRVSIPESSKPTTEGAVDLGVAIAFGLKLGATAPPLLAQRWEEGWQQPLESWREALGIRNLISQSPFPPLAGETKAKTEALLVGSWRLRSLKIQRPGSPDVTPIWGEQPLGQLNYTANGFMSAVLCQRERNHSHSSAGAADDAEQARLFRESYGYAGRYSLTTDGVIHHVEVATDPNWIGTDLHHVTQINGSELTISTTAIANVVDQTPVSLVAVWQKLQTDSY